MLGMIIMAVGFFTVVRTDIFLQSFGDLGEMFGIPNASWMSWKMAGILLMFVGFMIAFGLLQLFFRATIGQLFLFTGF
jgi:hypothetical protein